MSIKNGPELRYRANNKNAASEFAKHAFYHVFGTFRTLRPTFCENLTELHAGMTGSQSSAITLFLWLTILALYVDERPDEDNLPYAAFIINEFQLQ